MGTAIRGRILGHSASEIFKDGSVKFAGIEEDVRRGDGAGLPERQPEQARQEAMAD